MLYAKCTRRTLPLSPNDFLSDPIKRQSRCPLYDLRLCARNCILNIAVILRLKLDPRGDLQENFDRDSQALRYVTGGFTLAAFTIATIAWV
jgi:hypothetical protein